MRRFIFVSDGVQTVTRLYNIPVLAGLICGMGWGVLMPIPPKTGFEAH